MKRFYLCGLLALLLLAVGASALETTPVRLTNVEVDGTTLSSTSANFLNLERGQEIEVFVQAEFSTDVDNVRITADIPGYEFDTLDDHTRIFDIEDVGEGNLIRPARLRLTLPVDMEGDTYPLKIEVSARGFQDYEETFNLLVSLPRRDVLVEDVVVQPSNSVRAGTGLFIRARVENFGKKVEDSVKVDFEVPELGLKDTAYINNLDSDSQRSVEEIMLRVPACTVPGQYDLHVAATYARDHFRSPVVTETFTVVEGDLCATSSSVKADMVQFGDAAASASAGDTIVVPLTITNTASNARTFVVRSQGVDTFADMRVSPSNTMVLKRGQTAVVLAHLLVNEDAKGSQTYSVSVMNEDEMLGSHTYTTLVNGGRSGVNTLAVLLTLLIVILVVIAVLVGLSRRDAPKAQYY